MDKLQKPEQAGSLIVHNCKHSTSALTIIFLASQIYSVFFSVILSTEKVFHTVKLKNFWWEATKKKKNAKGEMFFGYFIYVSLLTPKSTLQTVIKQSYSKSSLLEQSICDCISLVFRK